MVSDLQSAQYTARGLLGSLKLGMALPQKHGLSHTFIISFDLQSAQQIGGKTPGRLKVAILLHLQCG